MQHTHPVLGRALWVPKLGVGLEGGRAAPKTLLNTFEGVVRGGIKKIRRRKDENPQDQRSHRISSEKLMSFVQHFFSSTVWGQRSTLLSAGQHRSTLNSAAGLLRTDIVSGFTSSVLVSACPACGSRISIHQGPCVFLS